jgi:hypothetical protein
VIGARRRLEGVALFAELLRERRPLEGGGFEA